MNGTPEQIAALAAALAAVQAELPEVGKNRTADVKNKEGRFLYAYSYADLSDVSAAVLPVLGRHDLAFAAFPGHQPDGKFGLRYYLLHSAGGSLEGFFEIDDKGGMQLVGGRITYARRYCLCAVTGITADEDVDAREGERSRTAQRKPRTSSPPPAQAATRPRPAAGSVPVTGTGGDLPPLPGEEPGEVPARTDTLRVIAKHLDRLGVEQRNFLRVTAQIAEDAVGSSEQLTEAAAQKVADTVKSLEDGAALDGLLADRLMEIDQRKVPGDGE